MRSVHVHFISSVSAHHVQNGEAATRMPVDPCGQVEGVSLVDDDVAVLGDEALDLGNLEVRL